MQERIPLLVGPRARLRSTPPSAPETRRRGARRAGALRQRRQAAAAGSSGRQQQQAGRQAGRQATAAACLPLPQAASAGTTCATLSRLKAISLASMSASSVRARRRRSSHSIVPRMQPGARARTNSGCSTRAGASSSRKPGRKPGRQHCTVLVRGGRKKKQLCLVSFGRLLLAFRRASFASPEGRDNSPSHHVTRYASHTRDAAVGPHCGKLFFGSGPAHSGGLHSGRLRSSGRGAAGSAGGRGGRDWRCAERGAAVHVGQWPIAACRRRTVGQVRRAGSWASTPAASRAAAVLQTGAWEMVVPRQQAIRRPPDAASPAV